MAMQRLFDEPWLSEDDVTRILSLAPKCWKCSGIAKYVYFYTTTKHEMWIEVDGSHSSKMTDNDRLLVSVANEASEEVDTQPDGRDYPRLECENGHDWVETHFVVDRKYMWLRERK